MGNYYDSLVYRDNANRALRDLVECLDDAQEEIAALRKRVTEVTEERHRERCEVVRMCNEREAAYKNLTNVQERCNELLTENRMLRRLINHYDASLLYISKCNDGKGLMPELAKRAITDAETGAPKVVLSALKRKSE